MRFIAVTKEADHKVFLGSLKGLGSSLTVVILEPDNSLKHANFPIAITPVASNETGAEDNAKVLQKVIKENGMENISKELFLLNLKISVYRK